MIPAGSAWITQQVAGTEHAHRAPYGNARFDLQVLEAWLSYQAVGSKGRSKIKVRQKNILSKRVSKPRTPWAEVMVENFSPHVMKEGKCTSGSADPRSSCFNSHLQDLQLVVYTHRIYSWFDSGHLTVAGKVTSDSFNTTDSVMAVSNSRESDVTY